MSNEIKDINLIAKDGSAFSAQVTVEQINEADNSEPDAIPAENGAVYVSDPVKGISHISREGQVTKVSAPMRVTAMTYTRDGKSWGMSVHFMDPAGHPHDVTILLREFASPKDLESKLMAEGLAINDVSIGNKRYQAIAYLRCVANHVPSWLKLQYVSERTGWIDQNFLSFVLPGSTVTEEGEKAPALRSTKAVRLKQRGTLEDWSRSVGRLACKSLVVMLALCAAIAAPLLGPLGLTTVGLYLYGQTKSGKSNALRAAASLFGLPTVEGTKLQARATDNSLEKVASMHYDLLMVLDEFTQLKREVLDDVIYMLGNQQGKLRMDRNRELDETFSWRLIYITTAEDELNELLLKKRGTGVKGGEAARLISLHAHPTSPTIWGNMPQTEAIAENVSMSRMVEASYGVAGRAYVEALVKLIKKKGLGALRLSFDDYTSEFMKDLTVASPRDQYVLSYFALFGFAGELAVDFGIFPWQSQDATKACKTAAIQWLAEAVTNETRTEKALADLVVLSDDEVSHVFRVDARKQELKEVKSLKRGTSPAGRKATALVYVDADPALVIFDRLQFQRRIDEIGRDLSVRMVKGRLEAIGALISRPEKNRRPRYKATRAICGMLKGQEYVLVLPPVLLGQENASQIRQIVESALSSKRPCNQVASDNCEEVGPEESPAVEEPPEDYYG